MKVDFFIVGEPKSGTTALASFLSRHPEITISDPKEPGYFATDFIRESDLYHGREAHPFIRTFDQYSRCFDNTGNILGDASTTYLYSSEAAANIHKHNPDARIIVMLRNPVDFLHSLHMQFVNQAHEDEEDFLKALALQPRRKAGEALPKNVVAPSFLQYTDWADYSTQIARYQRLFGADNIKIIISELFQENNEGTYKEVCEFLSVSPAFVPAFRAVHYSVAPRSKSLNRLLNMPALKNGLLKIVGLKNYQKIRRVAVRLMMKKKERSPLPESSRQETYLMLKPCIEKASETTGMDLAGFWKS